MIERTPKLGTVVRVSGDAVHVLPIMYPGTGRVAGYDEDMVYVDGLDYADVDVDPIPEPGVMWHRMNLDLVYDHYGKPTGA